MATEEACFPSLPTKIWVNIFKLDILDVSDICRMSQVSHRFHELTSSDDIWKAKLCQGWPVMAELDLTVPAEGWRSLCRLRKELFKQVEQQVREVASKNYNRDEISNEEFTDFLQAEASHEKGLYFVWDDLLTILNSHRFTRLTDKYYSRRIINFIRHKLLQTEIETFLHLPYDQQHLEKGAHLVTSWMQSTKKVEYSVVREGLDGIADKVRALLRSQSTGTTVHPACNKDNTLTGFSEHMWSGEQTQEVLKAINVVMYDQLGFKGNSEDYQNDRNSFIDVVLETKKGIPITLSIIYSAVARRLGVVCQPVNFPNHFLLAFKQHKPFRSENPVEVVYIDAFNKGRVMTDQECMSTILSGRPYQESYFYTINTHLVLERMARNMVCILRENTSPTDTLPVFKDSISLFLAISPGDLHMTLIYTNLCLHLNTNLPEALTMLRSTTFDSLGLTKQCEEQMKRNKERRETREMPKLRAMHPEVEFSVGMVMKHKKYNYMCVIYGWDERCRATSEWIYQMGVHRLSRKQHQPFYNVLVPDGSTRYAAEENLLYTRDTIEIAHKEVGRFFQEFTGRYYIANPSKLAEYPQDNMATRTLVNQFFNSSVREEF